MDARERPLTGAVRRRSGAPILYTGQDVARFCEVDLKTIHHWADAGKIPHYRTEGRHLRFRRNELVRFLRAHGYPLHDEITSVRPTIFFAASTGEEDPTKRLSPRFFVERFEHVVGAIARIVSDGPDVLVCTLADATFGGLSSLRALKRDPATAYVHTVVVGEPITDEGVDLCVAPHDLGKLGGELARALGL